jgi:hypothetical protein
VSFLFNNLYFGGRGQRLVAAVLAMLVLERWLRI